MEIYLDNSATTKPCEEAVEACVMAMQQEWGNPSSLHKKGFRAEQMVNSAKEQLAKALSCNSNEIIFTSGATESNNLAIIGSAMANKRKGNKIISTAIEHPSVKEAMEYLEKSGFEIQELSPNQQGEYDEQVFLDAVDDNTILVSYMFINNETGLILPIEQIAKAVKQKNAKTIVHVDAVQGFLKQPIKLRNSSIDLLSVSGHKVYAPKGVGALYMKKGVRLITQTYGGSQQNGFRAGTESTPLICAFGAAVKVQREQIEENVIHYRLLKEHLTTLLKEIKEVSINSTQNSAPHIINIAINQIRSEVMLHFLEKFGIYISSGSACSKGKESYVLTALGFEKNVADTSIRVSFGVDTTTTMLDEFVIRLKQGIESLAKVR